MLYTLTASDREKLLVQEFFGHTMTIPVRTLDDILTEACAPRPLDFLPIDIEGHEIEVLSGFDFASRRPWLILIEDHVANLVKHKFLRRA